MLIDITEIIAEIGCNHQGDFTKAMRLIETAAFCGCDTVKFQKRNNREYLAPDQYDAPHENPCHAYGETYGAHREFLEFDLQTHELLKTVCEEVGLNYGCSVWDLTSAREVSSLNPIYMKVPSACNNNTSLLEYLCENYGGDIHISLGMTTYEEERDIVSFVEKYGRLGDLVLYACTSGYPVDYDDICLMEIKRLLCKYGGKIKAVGFSGHHLGTSVDMAAVALGASYIERHFTLDKKLKGTDHSASLEPHEMAALVSSCTEVSKALKYKPSEILDVERKQRGKLKHRKGENPT